MTTTCFYCIDQMTPIGTEPVFGPVYQRCHACTDPCTRCHGEAVFPALTGYFQLLANALAILGYDIRLCRGCLGVTAIYHRQVTP